MINWIRCLLRSILQWLLHEEEKPLSRMIEVNEGIISITLKAVGVVGLALICEGKGLQRLVRIEDARDREHFKALWKSLGGGQPTWADGTPYEM